jgi:hypothetical protein
MKQVEIFESGCILDRLAHLYFSVEDASLQVKDVFNELAILSLHRVSHEYEMHWRNVFHLHSEYPIDPSQQRVWVLYQVHIKGLKYLIVCV